MRSQRWAWTHRYGVPLFVASVVSVLLAGGGLIAVVALGGDDNEGENHGSDNGGRTETGASPGPQTPGASPGPQTPGALPSLGADADCVVGRWRMVESRSEHPSGIFTQVGDGPVVEYRADGTGATDYGDGVQFAVTDKAFGGLGNTDTTVRGTVHHDYVVRGDTMQYVNMVSEATFEVEILGDVTWELGNEPFTFGCAGDTMTHEIPDRYQSRLERLDP